MAARLARHRKFEYTPHYYKPENSEPSTHRKRIRFRHLRRENRKHSLLWMGATLGFLLYLIYLFAQIGK